MVATLAVVVVGRVKGVDGDGPVGAGDGEGGTAPPPPQPQPLWPPQPSQHEINVQR